RQAVALAIAASLALHSKVNSFSRFARKNYFYPDLPKGYQISQYDEPVAEHGSLDIFVGGERKRIGITRVHMEADAYLTEMKQVLQYIGVSDCDMEKGQLRCDANVSVRLKGAPEFGTKAEVKNLNSFRFLKMALDYEVQRQVELIESGGKVAQETRLFNSETGETVGMRSKEHAHDYRYFPEPDLVPLRVSQLWL